MTKPRRKRPRSRVGCGRQSPKTPVSASLWWILILFFGPAQLITHALYLVHLGAYWDDWQRALWGEFMPLGYILWASDWADLRRGGTGLGRKG